MAATATDRHDRTDTAERLFSAAEAAAILGASERTVRRRLAAGELPSIKVGNQRRIPAGALGVSPDHDSVATPAAGQRRPDAGQMAALSPAPDIAPLVAVIERQGQEIARLTAALAVAEERLRQLPAGGNATGPHTTSPEGAGREEAPTMARATPWWAFWRR